MYTELLDAALERRSPREPKATLEHAVLEVRRCHRKLIAGVPESNLDTVPAVLALQIGYDVALLELAEVAGIESGPSRFEQPERERDRLCRTLNEIGIELEAAVEPVGCRGAGATSS